MTRNQRKQLQHPDLNTKWERKTTKAADKAKRDKRKTRRSYLSHRMPPGYPKYWIKGRRLIKSRQTMTIIAQLNSNTALKRTTLNTGGGMEWKLKPSA